jgi:hypothetical protein
MESFAHQRLKVLSIAFLRAVGCAAAATEVRCPASRFRTDVAGFADPLNKRANASRLVALGGYSVRVPDQSTTVLVECKQSRADFLKDNRRLEELLSERRDLDDRRRHLEERLIKPAEPHLIGSGSMLFPELETWDFASSRSPSYRAVLRDLRRVDMQIHGDTKFCMVARYRLADLLLVAAPSGMLRAREVPPGWGLLEFPAESLEPPPAEALFRQTVAVHVRHASVSASVTRPEHRVRLLRNIAVAATSRRAPIGVADAVPGDLRVSVRPRLAR